MFKPEPSPVCLQKEGGVGVMNSHSREDFEDSEIILNHIIMTDTCHPSAICPDPQDVQHLE